MNPNVKPKKPDTFNAAVAAMESTPSADEAAELNKIAAMAGMSPSDVGGESPGEGFDEIAGMGDYEERDPDAPPHDPSALPEWVKMPAGFKMPPGKQVAFMLFKKEWTDRPELGDRQCIIWPLSLSDEKVSLKRARNEAAMVMPSQTMQTIRAIDGMKSDWTGRPAAGVSYSVAKFYDEIGAKCRSMLENYYLKSHVLSADEQADFFLNCLAVRSAVAG